MAHPAVLVKFKNSGVQREVQREFSVQSYGSVNAPAVQSRFSYIANFGASPRSFSLVRGIAVYCNIF